MIKEIKSFLNNLKLNARFNLFISLLLAIIFSVLGYYLYITQKQDIFRTSDKQLRVLLEDLINIFEVQTNLKEKNIESSMKYALSFFYNLGGINEVEDHLDLQITNEREQKRVIKVKRWYLNTTLLQYNYDFVDQTKGGGVDFATVFQKTSEGYVRISTNLVQKDSTRAVGTVLPYNSPIIEAIENGKRFNGRIYVINDWYLTSYVPIFVKGEVAGILGIGVKQIDYETLKPLFYNKRYFQSGYPYVVSGDGISLINKLEDVEGSNLNITGKKFLGGLRKAKEINQEKFRYKWPEDETGVWKWTYVKYYAPLDIYIATSLFEDELYTGIDEIKKVIIIGVVVAILIFFVGISMIVRPITTSIKRLASIISSMSEGNLVDKIHYNKKDEIGEIISSLNKLIKGLGETAKFSNEIGLGNFKSKFTPLSKNDILGNSLLEMRASLEKAKREEIRRKKEDEKRNWTTEGLAIFNDILRKSSDDITVFADKIMKQLIKYLHANQGGLFIKNDENNKNIEFDLISTYALDRKKFIEKKIKQGEGLVGTCAIEKETIYLKEIPEDYIAIESGLGMVAPRALVLVPLKLDLQVLGVLEIASLKDFEKHEINFIEKLGENIASTLATAKMNVQTKKLLQESRKQSEELAVKEEQMRVNLAELQETQEESAKRQAEMSGVVGALASSFLVAEIDIKGNIIKINDTFLQIFNMSESEVIGKKHRNLIILDDEQKQKYDEFWENIKIDKKSAKIQSKHISDFREYWLSETYTPIYDNNGIPYKVLNIAIDITKNKNQELEIQKLLADSRRKAKKLVKQEKLNSYNVEKLARTQAESARKEAELKNILNAIDNTALRGEYTTDGTIITINENYTKVMGYNRDEMIGKRNRTFIPPDELPEFEKAWQRVLLGEAYNDIVKRKTKTNKELWLLMSYSSIKDKHGNIVKILFIGHDITEQKIKEMNSI